MVTVKLKQRDLKIFYDLRRSSRELGGIIEVGDKKSEVKIVNGERSYITVDTLPRGEIQFHTHPEIPVVKKKQDSIDASIERFDKQNMKGDFPINTLVQPISDDDLIAMTTSLVENRNCVMLVFCPEGIYVIHRTAKNGSWEDLKREYKKIDKWNKASKEYLRERDNNIVDYFDDKYLEKYKKLKSHHDRRKLLKDFQHKTGRAIVKIAHKHIPLLSINYYRWDVNEIVLKDLQCKVCKF